MSTVVVLQSAYIPWKGYFHLMHEADLFVFHDDLQFTPANWRSRNRIMTPSGPRWLSIPAGGDENRRICDVEIADPRWKKQHRRALELNYRRAPCFRQYEFLLDDIYHSHTINLSDFNQHAIHRLARVLGIDTPLDDSRRFQLTGRKTERLIELLSQLGAREYLSGPAGRNYLDQALFDQAGIALRYFEYPRYPDYPQRFGGCTHDVTILDMLFNIGSETPRRIWE